MSLRRRVSWSTALQNLKADRERLPAGAVSAKSYVQTIAKLRKRTLVTATGAYDRSAIMSLAIEAAKLQQARTGAAWSTCMTAALKGAWMAAKDARYRAAH